jgi:hypothetical protein
VQLLHEGRVLSRVPVERTPFPVRGKGKGINLSQLGQYSRALCCPGSDMSLSGTPTPAPAQAGVGRPVAGPKRHHSVTRGDLPSSTRCLQLARRKRRKPPFTFGSNSSLATLPGRIRETRQQRQVMGARRKSHQLSLWSLAWCPSPRPCRRGTGAGHAPLCCAGTVPPDPAETATDTYATRNNHTKQKRRHKAVARAAVSGEGTEQTPPPRGLPRKGRMPRLLRTAVLGTGGRWRRGVGGGVGRAASPGGQAH